MAIDTPTEIALQDELRALAQKLDCAGHGQKDPLKNAACQAYGWSKDKLYRELKKIGWNSGRKRRADAGTTKCDEGSLGFVGALRQHSMRKNGKQIMFTPVAKSVAMANGYKMDASVSTINRQLSKRQLAPKHMKQDSPSVRMRSLYPNHVHQVDPSLCVLFYMPNGEQRIMEDDKFYKNKLDNYAKIKLKCWRYVLVDHTSNVVIVRYYAAAGENAENMWDFLCYCWGRKNNSVMHGVCDILYWDKGSANQAGSILNALRELDCQSLTHEPGRARAKGAVEGANNLVETQFECRLKFEPVNGVDELNAAVECWYNAYNSNSIPGQDTRLERRGMAQPVTRYGLWQTIKAEKLRVLPNRDICASLRRSVPVTRAVSSNLTISFKHPKADKSNDYSLRECAGVLVGMKVEVSALYFGEAQIRIVIKHVDDSESIHKLTPIEYDSLTGFPIDSAVFGEEFKALPDTGVEDAKKAADKLAYPDLDQDEIKKAKNKQKTPFGGDVKAHSYLEQSKQQAPSFMEKKGAVIQPPSETFMDEKPLSLIQAKKMISQRMSNRDLKPEEITWIHDNFTQVLPSQIESILTQLRNGVPAQPVLRVVNSKE